MSSKKNKNTCLEALRCTNY